MRLSQQELICPRCGYLLEGITEPRCPECGLAFDWESYAEGSLRENIPTWLDRADPWQPHQVLVRSLTELLRGMARPSWILQKLDLGGPRWVAPAMTVCGAFWLWLCCSVVLAVAGVVHTGASPAAAAKNALLSAGPRLVAANLLAALVPLPLLLAALRRSPRVPAARAAIRVGGYLLPVLAAYGTVCGSLIVLVQVDFMHAAFSRMPLLAVVAAALLLRLGRGPGFLRWRLLALSAALFAVWWWLAGHLAPDSLEPGWWVYGL